MYEAELQYVMWGMALVWKKVEDCREQWSAGVEELEVAAVDSRDAWVCFFYWYPICRYLKLILADTDIILKYK